MKGTPPLNSGLATVGAAKSPNVPKIPESSFPLSFLDLISQLNPYPNPS